MKMETYSKELENHYQIRVQGHLGPDWGEWFEGMQMIQQANGDTLLCGLLADQAALHGVLARIRDLGLRLLSVNSIVADDQGKGR